MSVIVIGDRGVGKTSMVVALSQLRTSHVIVESPEPQGFSRFYNPETNEVAGTRELKVVPLIINVDLPSGNRQIRVRWLDTPGEAFTDTSWKDLRLTEWQDIRGEVKKSKGVILLLPPHRDMLQEQFFYHSRSLVDPDDFPLERPWIYRLSTWFQFFRENCSRGQHVILCLHKADLFCDIETEAKKWRYKPAGNRPWYEHNQHVKNSYFNAAQDMIRECNRDRNLPEFRFFITTTYSPDLLELPWIYLGSYLANTAFL
jgi:GTPase SAR1 family protein